MPTTKEEFVAKANRHGYPEHECPPAYNQQWIEGEQASFDEEPYGCPYALGSAAAYWWQQGFDAAEAVTAALDDDSDA